MVPLCSPLLLAPLQQLWKQGGGLAFVVSLTIIIMFEQKETGKKGKPEDVHG